MIELFDNLAKILFNNKKFKDAADIIMIASKYAENEDQLKLILSNAKMAYFQANDVHSAYACLEKLEDLGEEHWTLQRDKANYLRYLERHDEALDIVKNKLPENGTKYLALGWFLHKEGKTKEAFEITEKGIHDNYWWGNKAELPYSNWDGKSFVENLIIAAESGNGDEIIFSRWIPDLKKHCKNLYYYTNNSLSTVFSRVYGIKKYDPSSKLDYRVAPMMSLPYLLGVDSPIPKKYLTADSKLVDEYNKKYPKTSPRIGLCFHGEVTHIETNLRTLPRDYTVNLFKDIGELVNLQKDYDTINKDLKYYRFDTWEDTLALIETCDIIVTCDTSVSHAAAALGKTTVVLMHPAAYFTWNHNGNVTKSLWYENAWCVKQKTPCVWEDTLEAAKQLTTLLLNEKRMD
jgi:tetratricopeptide (TPR) repeat protein